MSAPPINLSELRARAVPGRIPHRVTMKADVLLALVEVVEAAQAFLDGPTRIENHPTAWPDLERLYAALARFASADTPA